MDIATITGPTVSTVSELLDLEDTLREVFAKNLQVTFAFRGQPRDYGSLIPSFQRQFTRKSVGAAEMIETRLIAAFRDHYARLGDRHEDMPTPEQIAMGFDLRCLSVMQHYEIPTRLLDWTSNMWKAVYFACVNDPGETAELWFYDREIFADQRVRMPSLADLMHPMSPPREPEIRTRRREELLVELDPRISPRMKHQEAHHTVSTNAFADHAPLLFEMSQTAAPPHKFGMHRILIDGSCKGKALQFLADEKNISASTIFPDVVGLGRFLRWQFDSLRTMYL